MITIGVIGGGFVGKATELFANDNVTVKIYDLDKTRCSNGISELSDLKNSDFIFICVNTPMISDSGKCYTKIVEDCIYNVRNVLNTNNIIIRSTVPVGFCKKNNVMFIPEFLTEKNWKNDILNCKEWYFGIDSNNTNIIDKVTELFNYSFPSTNLNILTTEECELIKYFRNTFLAVKVGFCNEFASYCNELNVNYENVRKHASSDLRIGNSHTTVPGHDGFNGFSGHCLPKDLSSLINQMKEVNVKCPILDAVDKRNKEIDRTNQDWNKDLGRAVV